MARLLERLILARLKTYVTENAIIIAARKTKDKIIFRNQKVQESFIERKKTLVKFRQHQQKFLKENRGYLEQHPPYHI